MEWISVEEKLPEDKNYVLFFERWEDYLLVGRYDAENDQWIPTENGRVIIGDAYSESCVEHKCVTHWQPLPEPPK